MRVLLCHQPTDGGVGRHIRDLIDGLTANGQDVVVCSPGLPRGTTAAVAHIQLDLRRAIAPRSDLAALAKLAGIIRTVRPDVIHAHSSKAGAVARLAKLRDRRVPVAYSPHGFAFAGHFSRSLERHVYLDIERALTPLASAIVCVCEAEARLARPLGAREKVRVVYNGIDPAPAGPIDGRIAELSQAGPVIGALTLLRPGKGLETLIAALPQVLARHPSAQLAVVGEGPDLENLSADTRALGIAGSVHFLGASEDPLSVLRGLDIFVHPSWAEAFPYVILEAMSLGRAIVASDVGGIGEAVIDGDSGVLVPPRDQAALAGALIGLLEDAERRVTLGGAASRRAERFTSSAMIERLVSLYGELARKESSHGLYS